MGVYVKGMEMPKECRECLLQVYYSSGKTWCKSTDMILAEDYKPIPFDGRPKWCPLVEVPEPHGRLIDENEVRTVMNWLLTQPQRPTWNDTYHAIQEMDAVIEAEGSNDTRKAKGD